MTRECTGKELLRIGGAILIGWLVLAGLYYWKYVWGKPGF